MSGTKRKSLANRFKSNFSFGGLMAESDPLLSEAYWDNGDFEVIASPKARDPRCIIVGRTGSGKSAALQYLEESEPGKVIRILPENLSLPYITNLSVIRQLPAMGVHLEPLFVALWKHVILVEVIKNRYNITTPEQKTNILNNLRERLKKNSAKVKALDYLDEFGDKFWCETDERVRQIADTVEQKFARSGGLEGSLTSIGAKASANMEETHTQEERQELVTRYQKIVNETQLPRLNEMIVILNDEILDSLQHLKYLVIDDLDKEWVDSPFVNMLIRCLFQAVVDIQRVKHLKIIVAIRTNLFEQVGYGQQSPGGQEEKFRGLALHIRWTENDLRNLLDHRASIASKFYNFDPPKTLSQMLPNVNRRAGDPINYILSRTLLRPRDAILFLNECVRVAAGKDRISWEDIHKAEKPYSVGRLQALRDEWKNPYPDIDKIFDKFRRRSHILTRSELSSVLEEASILSAEPDFHGASWLTPMFDLFWSAGSKDRQWYELYGEMVKLLFDISFLGIARNRSSPAIYSHREPGLAQFADNMTEHACFEIHPAFRQALDVRELQQAA
jgi:hypothetical protein